MIQPLILTDEFLLFQNDLVRVYLHPFQLSQCIKFPLDAYHNVLDIEVCYRKCRQWKKLPDTLIASYHSLRPETNLGLGYLFDAVRDYDTGLSRSVLDFFEDVKYQILDDSYLFDILKQCRDALVSEHVITYQLDMSMFVVQFVSKDIYRVRYVGTLGYDALFPFAYYFDYFSKRHIVSQWNNALKTSLSDYPDVLTNDMVDKLWL